MLNFKHDDTELTPLALYTKGIITSSTPIDNSSTLQPQYLSTSAWPSLARPNIEQQGDVSPS